MKKSLFYFALGLLVIAILLFAVYARKGYARVVRVGDVSINAEFARSADEKAKGLCCRDSLGANSGMLFVYDNPGLYRFWMKDTRIPLDMYWISSEKKIVHIEHSVKPESFPKTYGPQELAQYILETNAGFAKQNNINVGDSVSF